MNRNLTRIPAAAVAILISLASFIAVGRAWATGSVANASRTTYTVNGNSAVQFALPGANFPAKVLIAGTGQYRGVATMTAMFDLTGNYGAMTLAGFDYLGNSIRAAVIESDMLSSTSVSVGAYPATQIQLGITTSDPNGAHLPDRLRLVNLNGGAALVTVTQIW